MQLSQSIEIELDMEIGCICNSANKTNAHNYDNVKSRDSRRMQEWPANRSRLPETQGEREQKASNDIAIVLNMKRIVDFTS